jgi:hypothetical protein
MSSLDTAGIQGAYKQKKSFGMHNIVIIMPVEAVVILSLCTLYVDARKAEVTTISSKFPNKIPVS